MKTKLNQLVIMLCVALLFPAVSFAQGKGAGAVAPADVTATSSSMTLKTVRALFPDVPVAVANELFGGLHSVADIAALHSIEDNLLQEGMLVYVKSTSMYYRYLGSTTTTYNGAGTDAAVANPTYWKDLSEMLLEATTNHVFTENATDAVGDKDATNHPTWRVGDININDDKTEVYDGSTWTNIAEKVDVTKVDITSIPATTQLTIGDINIYEGVVSVYNGATWDEISRTDDAKAKYQVFTTTDNTTTQTAWLAKVTDQSAFRELVKGLTVTGATEAPGDGISIYYPAFWGDFTYAIEYTDGNKYELTNGITVSTEDISTEIYTGKGDVTVSYKKVTIPSRKYPVYVY